MKLTEKMQADFYAELEGLARKYSPSLELANLCVAGIFDKLKGDLYKYDTIEEVRISLYIQLLQSPCLGGQPYGIVPASEQKRRLMLSKYAFGVYEVRFRSK
jgi:hypothetical protein